MSVSKMFATSEKPKRNIGLVAFRALFCYFTSENVMQCNFNAAKEQMIVTSFSKKGSMEMARFLYGKYTCGLALFY